MQKGTSYATRAFLRQTRVEPPQRTATQTTAQDNRSEDWSPSEQTKVMIVYGGQAYCTSLSAFAGQVRSRALREMRSGKPAAHIEELRTLLVLAGQLEQGACDVIDEGAGGVDASRLAELMHAVTQNTGRAFYRAWAENSGQDSRRGRDVDNAIDRVLDALSELQAWSDLPIRVTLPEGFSYYALYPEQYCAAARRWLVDHAGHERTRVAVVGVRSIGTGLAAVVAAALEEEGWEARRLTVRPSGHPFAREVRVNAEQLEGAVWGLVVDEGPGMSGSSMAAVATAMVSGGMEPGRVSFFPGHKGGPGSAGSSEVKEWWSLTPRYVVPLEDGPFSGGCTLLEELTSSTNSLVGSSDKVLGIKDFGGGAWRRATWADRSRWPALNVPFSRPKYLCTLASGRKILLKYEGLAGLLVEQGDAGAPLTLAESVSATMSGRAAEGYGVTPLGNVKGFVATEWLHGDRLAHSDRDPALLAHIGRYLAQTAGPPLSEEEHRAGLLRLGEMLYWNTWELLGEETAACTRDLVAVAAQAGIRLGLPSYTDGHMAPHEWLRTPEGRIVKTDCAGHPWDHSMVGHQPLAWAVAAALVEWDLDARATRHLLDAFYAAGGEAMSTPAFHMYRMAYAAFRAGQSTIAMQATSGDPEEHSRQSAQFVRYRRVLSRLIEESATAVDSTRD
jgi:hypothetical protein